MFPCFETSNDYVFPHFGNNHVSSCSLLFHDLCLKMSLFKKFAVKRSNNKGKELVIDLGSFSPKSKKTQSSTGVFDDIQFRSYTAYQAYMNYFKDAPYVD